MSYCLVIDSFHYNSKVMCQHTRDRPIVPVPDPKPTPAWVPGSQFCEWVLYTESDVWTGWSLRMRLGWPTRENHQIKSWYDQSGYVFVLHVGNAWHQMLCYSLVPRLSHLVVFDRLPVCSCACIVEGIKKQQQKTGRWEGLGTKLAKTCILYAVCT